MGGRRCARMASSSPLLVFRTGMKDVIVVYSVDETDVGLHFLSVPLGCVDIAASRNW